MRLRSEYLWQRRKARRIRFRYAGGKYFSWEQWRRGIRPHRQGRAIVYRATDMETEQQVAVKLLRVDRLEKGQDGMELARFEQEMELIQKISHPHVVDIPRRCGNLPVAQDLL